MQQRIDSKRARYQFDSLADLARYIDATPKTWRLSSSTDASYGRDWDLGASWGDALNMARNGWLEGAQRAQKALKAFAPATPRPATRTDFYGHMPHVPRFCAGAPDAMVRYATPPLTGQKKVLTLIVPVNASAMTDAPYMANFGLAVAQYINQLQVEGVQVEVIGAIVSEVSRVRVAHTFTIKKAHQPLDLAVMAFAIGHPAMFRRLGFGLRERCAAKQSSAYGSSVPAKVDDVINVPQGAIVLNGMTRANEIAQTPERALEYITGQIERKYNAD